MQRRPGQVDRFRSVATVLGALCSVAAVLASPAAAGTINVSTTADQFGGGSGCGLREAFQAANNDVAFGGCTGASGADLLKLPGGVYKLTIPPAGGNLNDNGDLDNFQALTLDRMGSGKVVIDAGNIDRAIEADGLGNDLVLRNLTVRNGRAPDNGGGILNVVGSLTLENVTLTGNQAMVDGGGLSNYSIATLVNTTISGNQARGSGGGIQAPGSSATTLRNVTIAGNTADSDASGNGEGGGISTQDTFSTYNTLIGDNVDSSPDAPDKNPDCFSGPDFFPRHTLIEVFNAATCLVGFSPGTNIAGQDPKLGPLADNGGSTPTRALLGGSPALGKGGASGIDECAPTDQRGAARPAPGCDIGAYQRVLCKGRAATRVGGGARDVLRGTAKADVFLLLGGNDKATGTGGNDVFCGGAGRDVLLGGKGNDLMLGEAGGDRLIGGAGRDNLIGGRGADRLIGGPARDRLLGGPGKDIQRQ